MGYLNMRGRKKKQEKKNKKKESLVKLDEAHERQCVIA
jgi:hypothetical protein